MTPCSVLETSVSGETEFIELMIEGSNRSVGFENIGTKSVSTLSWSVNLNRSSEMISIFLMY